MEEVGRVIVLGPKFMGLDVLQLAMFAVARREENPTVLMPWEWDQYKETVTHQIEIINHLIWQHALDGRDFLRAEHIRGSHWYILPWEPSPNDRLENGNGQ